MNVSHKVGWVWWATARCASRATSEVLKFYEFYDYSVTPPVNIFHEPHSHLLAIPQGYENYKLLMQVRNPYSRLVSYWHLECYKVRNDKLAILESFESYAKTVMSDITNCVKVKTPDYIVRYEHLALDISNIPFVDLKNEQVYESYNNNIVHNSYKTEGVDSVEGELKRDLTNPEYADWRSYYTQYLADMVYENHKEQFEAFNYDRYSWKRL